MKKFFAYLASSVFAFVFFAAQAPALAQEVKEAVSIDFLDSKSVSIFKSKYIKIEGVDYKIGARDAMSFKNSESGRKSLAENVSEPLLSTILGVWSKSENKSKTSGIAETMSIESLDNKYVSFVKVKRAKIDGTDYILDDPQVVFYENSSKDRELVAKDVPEPFLSTIMTIWGDTPTIILPEPEKIVDFKSQINFTEMESLPE